MPDKGLDPYFWVYAQVFPTRQTKAHEAFLFRPFFLSLRPLYTVVHKTFKFCQGFLNLGNSTRAVY